LTAPPKAEADRAVEPAGYLAGLVAELQTRRAQRDVLEAPDADRLERSRRERGDRDRHLLQRFLALAGGDDDFLERRRRP